MKAGRRAPADGYDFQAKRVYRKQIWNMFRYFCAPRVSDAWSLLMPSSEGDEVDVAIAKGFRQDRMVIVDDNVAIVASLKGRKFPRVTARGGRVGTVAGRLAREGMRLHVANLDFTGHIGGIVDELKAFAESGVLAPVSCVAVTMLKGREPKPVTAAMQSLSRAIDERGVNERIKTELLSSPSNDPDLARYSRLMGTLGRANISQRVYGAQNALSSPSRLVLVERVNEYRSASGQTMLWAAFVIHSQPCMCTACIYTLAMAGGETIERTMRRISAEARLPIRDLVLSLKGQIGIERREWVDAL
jgi:hypothetical protein